MRHDSQSHRGRDTFLGHPVFSCFTDEVEPAPGVEVTYQVCSYLTA